MSRILSRTFISLIGFCFPFVLSGCGKLTSDSSLSADKSVITGIGSEITLRGRSDVCCGGSYERTMHQYVITLRNTSLPWGTQVYLHYGFKRIDLDMYPLNNQMRDWQVSSWAPFAAVAPYVWRIELSQVSHEMGQTSRLSDMQFVIKIVYPDGGEVFERGNDSNLGFFEAKDPSQTGACYNYNSEREPGSWCEMRIFHVERG